MAWNQKSTAIVQTGALTVSSVIAALAAGGPDPTMAVVAGGMTAAAGVLGNYLVNTVSQSEAQKNALAAVLHNEHLAIAAANAVVHTILAAKDVLDESTRGQIAAAASHYWLKCQKAHDPRTKPYAEQELATRLSEYLTSDLADPLILLPQWKEVLLESAADAKLSLKIPDESWNTLAGHLCRDYPKRLYNAFKGDLEHGGAAFGGIVLRMLSQLLRDGAQLTAQPPPGFDPAPLMQRLDAVADLILLQTRDLAARLDEATRQSLAALGDLASELRDRLKSIQRDTTALLAASARQEAALAELRQMVENAMQGGSQEKLQQKYEDALRFIAAHHALPLDELRALIDERTTRTIRDPHAQLREKVQALREAGRFLEARDFALEAANELARHRQAATGAEIEMLLEASKSEIEFGNYAEAHALAIRAEALASREQDFLTWASARHQIGRALGLLRRDAEAMALYQELIPLRAANLGPEHPETLKSRNNLAIALRAQGKHAEAEQEHRAVLALKMHILGPEHPNTLKSRNNLAIALRAQGKHAEAEQEHRAVLALKMHILGPEHADTLKSRNNLTIALRAQGKHAEAEQEHRAVLTLRERRLGIEHPNTLKSRNNLAIALSAQGKHAEAEQEYRAVLALQERILGLENPDVFTSCYNLTFPLVAQKKHLEALRLAQRTEKGRKKLLGADHPKSKSATKRREEIEARMKASHPTPPPAEAP